MRNTVVVVTVLAVSLLGAGCECGDPEGPDGGTRFDGFVPGDGGFGFDAGRVPPGTLAEGTVCTPGGWCWETPQPAGGIVSGLWSPEEGRVIAGTGTFMFHIEDDVIRHAAPPTLTPYLNGIPVWGASANDVWANAFSSLIRFDGTRWTEAASTVSYASGIHGYASDDVWATGFSQLNHYDGSGWTTIDTSAYPDATFVDAWAFGPEEAIVVGADMDRESLVLHVGPGGITDLGFPSGSVGGALSVYASSADDVWTAAGGSIHRLSGGSWSEVASPGSYVGLTSSIIWGSGPDDVWIGQRDAVAHWDGSTLENMPLDTRLQGITAVAGTSPTDVWAADYDGQIHHYDGTEWTVRFKETVTDANFQAISVGDDGVGWAVGFADGIAERDPSGTWTEVASPTAAQLVGVARAGTESFLFAMGGAYRRNGSDWEVVIGGDGLRDACATDDGTVWAIGDRVARFMGDEFVTEPDVVAPTELARIWCRGDEAWAVPQRVDPEDGVSVLHLDASGWGLWGLGSVAHLRFRDAVLPTEDEGWYVAQTATDEGIVMRLTDGVWRQDTRIPTTVRGVGASGPNDVWLVGASLARRWNGTDFETHDPAAAPALEWVGPGSGGATLAVATAGNVWRFDGSWTEVGGTLADAGVTFSGQLVDAVVVAGEVYGVTDSQICVRFDGAAWTEIESERARGVVGSADAGIWFYDRSVGRYMGGAIVEPDSSFFRGELVAVPFTGSEVWATDGGAVYRLEGGSWVREVELQALDVLLFGHAAEGMWLLEPADVRADFTTVYRRRSATWEPEGELHQPVGFGTDEMGRDLFVANDWSIWRREADGLRRVIEPREGIRQQVFGGHLYDIDDAWVLALGGLLHFDGAAWSQLADSTGLGFNAFTSTPDGTLYAAGNGASIVSRSP